MGIMEPRRLGRLAGVAVPAAAGLEQDARWLKSKGGGDTDVTGTGVPKIEAPVQRTGGTRSRHADCEGVVGGKLQSLGGPHLFVLAETRSDRRCLWFSGKDLLSDAVRLAIIFSFAIGIASRNVCIGVFPKTPTSLMRALFIVLARSTNPDQPAGPGLNSYLLFAGCQTR